MTLAVTTAQKLGFAGGLVPGVEVYAYACHPAVARWGRAWLERGQMQCRFLKPVYDHRDGTFGRPAYVKPKEFVIAEGLLRVRPGIVVEAKPLEER